MMLTLTIPSWTGSGIVLAAAAILYTVERRRYRRQMADHMARKLRRGFVDAEHERWMRPVRPFAWKALTFGAVIGSLPLIWGIIHHALRHA